MDKLDTIFALQAELDSDIREKHGLDGYTQDEWVQKKMLALIAELAEVLDEINYKWWKKPKPVDKAALFEELADVLHFYVGMCIDAGMTADELFDIYTKKNRENHLRQEGKSEKGGYV